MTSTPPYNLHFPRKLKYPVIVSAPHVGTFFPPEVRKDFLPEVLAFPVDADWLVHELYQQIAEDLGFIMIWAKYSRYVVDLNRDPKGGQLYNDGRRETSVVPVMTFAGGPLYKPGHEPSADEINRRVLAYHTPYYTRIESLISELRQQHSNVLFYDAHSIKRQVPTIRPEQFPDMILGTNDGLAADEKLVVEALAGLKAGNYDVRRDETFKGGHLTRHFGRPQHGVHALQLERSWDIYLQDDPRFLDINKSERLRACLRKMFAGLVAKLNQL